MANQMGDASEGRAAGKGKPLNSIKHKQSKPVKAWIKNELNQQQKRFKKILQHMEDITPKREKWFQQFFDTISTRGQNIDGDTRMVIAKEDLPKKPRRKTRVTYEPKELKGFDH